MTIRDMDKFVSTLWDWGFLNACFWRQGSPTRIAMTDLDGIVETHGRFLVIETKSPGKKIDRGQRLTFDAMIRTGRIMVMIIWGDQKHPPWEYCWWGPGGEGQKKTCSEEDIKLLVARWFEVADALPSPDPIKWPK